MEQDEPLDPLNIGRNRPGAVITGTHGSPNLLKQLGHGMTFRIFPSMLFGIFNDQARPIQVMLHYSYLLH